MLNDRIEDYAIFSRGFRGLPDGWYSLTNCNFLVGENSSGKSSFLQLVEIIDSREHALLLDITGIVEGLDTPFDICSRASNAGEVTIGHFSRVRNDTPNRQKRGLIYGRLATYRHTKEGMQLVRLTVVSDNKAVRLKRQGSRIYNRVHFVRLHQDETHINNAKRLEQLHFDTTIRFRGSREVHWSEYPDGVVWQDEVQFVTAGAKGGVSNSARVKNARFQIAGPALNALHYGPMRAKTRRLYHGAYNRFSASGEHIAYMLKDVMKTNNGLKSSIERFGKASGLFDEISITSVSTAVKDKPFALQIKKGNSYYYVDELGYGVGQALPIVADICYTSGNNSFLIQQPELHLHPKAQSALGEVFERAASRGSVLVVETHSDFIIDKFRIAFRDNEKDFRAQIIFFQKNSSGENTAHEIEILKTGALSFIPDGYRDFFVDEAIQKFESLS